MEINDFILWCKRQEIRALEEAQNMAEIGDSPTQHAYRSGMANAFAQVWEYLTFGSVGTVHPSVYNAANEYWSKRANE